MANWQVIAGAWDWEPSVVLGCFALLVGYLYAVGLRVSWRVFSFLLGDLVLLLALISPLDTLGDTYLFTAHMIQHLLLLLIVPPLFLLAIPPPLWRRVKCWSLFLWIESAFSLPAVAWIVGTLTLAVWHLPVLYELALENNAIHILEHISFLVSAFIFWYPALVASATHHLSAPGAMIYFMAAGTANTLLAILIAFSPHVLYPTYAQPQDPLGILTWIRQDLGFTATTDQQVAGLLMWVPGSLPLIAASFAILIRWFVTGDREEQQAEAQA